MMRYLTFMSDGQPNVMRFSHLSARLGSVIARTCLIFSKLALTPYLHIKLTGILQYYTFMLFSSRRSSQYENKLLSRYWLRGYLGLQVKILQGLENLHCSARASDS